MAAMMDANVSPNHRSDSRHKAADGSLIKSPGELLTPTGEEAVKEYGGPQLPNLFRE